MKSILPFLKDEIAAQEAMSKYYCVVELTECERSDELFHMEKMTVTPSNAANDSYSVAKSVTAMALGILYDRGCVRPSDKITDILSESLLPDIDPKWKTVTLDYVLRHRTGAANSVDFDLTNANLWDDSEWLHTLFSYPIIHEPGREFVYSDGNYYLISRVVEQLCGVDLEAFLQREVFCPLGFHSNAWSRDPAGHTLGATGLYMRTEDMARLAWLYMNDGMWGERRIFSSDWAKRVRDTRSDCYSHYGYGVESLDNGAFGAAGMYGQGYYFNPSTRRVVAWHSYMTAGLMEACEKADS